MPEVRRGRVRPHKLARTPARDARIWRYLNLAKLLSLVQTQSLYFTRADRTGDPYEGTYPQSQLVLRNAAADAAWRVQDEEERRRFELLLEARGQWGPQVRESTYLNCWHVSQYESMAMWQLYADRAAGVAIASSYQRLVDALERGAERLQEAAIHDVTISLVSYGDSGPLPEDNTLYPYLNKHQSLEHERELRAIILYDGRPGLYVAADLPTLLERIQIAPASPDWRLEIVNDLIRRYGLTVPVSRSEIDRDPIY